MWNRISEYSCVGRHGVFGIFVKKKRPQNFWGLQRPDDENDGLKNKPKYFLINFLLILSYGSHFFSFKSFSSVIDMTKLLVIENNDFSTSSPALLQPFYIFLTVPVTGDCTVRSFLMLGFGEKLPQRLSVSNTPEWSGHDINWKPTCKRIKCFGYSIKTFAQNRNGKIQISTWF